MKSVTTSRFRKCFEDLPKSVQKQSRKSYALWLQDPKHPSLKFGRVHPIEPIFSVRIGLHWRAIAVVDDGVAVWFWIGSHSDYDKLLDSYE